MTVRFSSVVWLGLAACGLPDGDYFGRIPDDIDPAHFRWCNQGEPDFLDPARASSTVSAPLVSALFDGLTVYAPDGNPEPGLATHWEIEGLQTYTFHLRRDARWSNGRPLTAYDIAFSALRVAHPLTASPNADNISAIANLTGYLTRKTLVLAQAAGPYRAGTIVEVVDGDGARVPVRTSSKILALRDPGAPAETAYAHVPAGAEIVHVLTTGGRATLPHPDGRPWAYVHWQRDRDGVYGWVPAAELERWPHGDTALSVRAVAPASLGAWLPTVKVAARDLVHGSDAVGIRVVDAHTLVFELVAPTPYFLASTSSRALRAVPMEIVSRHPRTWTEPARIVTSGPLHLTYWKPRDRIELVRSPTYRDPQAVTIDRMTVYSMDDQAAATNFYFTGACDAVATNQIPSTYLPALNGELRGGRAYKDYRVDPYLTIYFLWVNTQKLANRHLRRAMSLAIDRTPVPRFTHGEEMPTSQLMPGTPIGRLSDEDLAACGVSRDTKGFAMILEAGKLCYVTPPGLDYDLAAARAELAKAREDRSWKEPIEYRYNSGSEAHKQIAEYLQAAWQRIGLEVVLVAQEWNSMLDDTREGRFEVARLGSAGSIVDPEEFLPLFRCGSPDNRGRYCSPEFEALMERARRLRDRKARNAVLREAESVMLQDAPVIPIYVYTQKHLIKPYVRGYTINLIDQPSLWRVSLDPDWRP